MPERAGGRGARMVIAFLTDKRVFGTSKNRFCTISGMKYKSREFLEFEDDDNL